VIVANEDYALERLLVEQSVSVNTGRARRRYAACWLSTMTDRG